MSGCSDLKSETTSIQINEKVNNIFIDSNDDEYKYIEEVYTQNSERIFKNSSNIKKKSISELNFHKIYLPKSGINYSDEYQNSGSFKSIISDNYYVESLVYDNKDNVVSAFRIMESVNEENTEQFENNNEIKYALTFQGLYIPSKWYEVINDRTRLESLIAKRMKDENVLNILILNINTEHMYLIFIEGESNEYGIPLTHREDFYFLENGKLYEISDIVDKW